MKFVDVSIIIVNFNTEKLVHDSIESIKRNTRDISYEIIVVDNASNEKLKKIDGTKVIYNKTNLGFSKANNIGIKEAKGKYILLLNSDTVIREGAIDKLYRFAKDNTDAGVVVPRLFNTDGSIQPSCFRLPTIGLAFKQYFLNGERLLDKYFPKAETPRTVECAVMACFLITPKGLDKVGKLDEKYFMYFEDIEYCKKINESGLKIYYLPTAQVIHLHGGSGAPNRYLVESSKKYHGIIKYYIFTFILWLGQKI